MISRRRSGYATTTSLKPGYYWVRFLRGHAEVAKWNGQYWQVVGAPGRYMFPSYQFRWLEKVEAPADQRGLVAL